jgi:hypothetical protein
VNDPLTDAALELLAAHGWDVRRATGVVIDPFDSDARFRIDQPAELALALRRAARDLVRERGMT